MEEDNSSIFLMPAVTNKYEDNKEAIEKFGQRVADLKQMNNQS